MAVPSATPPPPLSTVRAWTYLGINLIATPGLGSVWGGRKLVGRGQLYLSVTGFCLIVIWMFKLFFGITVAEINETAAVPVPAGWWKSGVLFFGIGWLWSLVTSVSMVLQATRAAGQGRLQTPPKLDDASKNVPPILPVEAPVSPQVEAALATVPEWKNTAAAIVRTFQFPDFPAALVFVNQVARLAEEAGHHPDIDIRWNKVTLALTTHDAGGLTEKDFALARQCDRLV